MDESILQLFRKFAAGECDARELEQVKQYISERRYDAEWQTVLAEEAQRAQETTAPLDTDFNEGRLFDRIKATLDLEAPPKVIRLWPRIAVAASVIVTIGIGSYFLVHQKETQKVAQTTVIKPGSRKAILTLSNGQRINLTDAHAGTLARQGGASVVKTANNQVVYGRSDTKAQEIVYNTITTPRGGFYPLQMPDGTLAILDAQSSIKYPVNGADRTVEITGQVYFEVKYDAAHPFRVKVKGQTIEDLGTVFNINAYDDEPVIRTTLAEGGIQLTRNDQAVILKPGQQAITQQDKNDIKVKTVNVDDVMAWKNGQTSFENEDVREIMRQACRWYDVDVEFQGDIPNAPYKGGISRTADIKDLLKILEFNGVHFTVSGRKIIVKP